MGKSRDQRRQGKLRDKAERQAKLADSNKTVTISGRCSVCGKPFKGDCPQKYLSQIVSVRCVSCKPQEAV